jgi:L-seryl-tRNA(Ser) seleniumtransferase
MTVSASRPPSVDKLARRLAAATGLPDAVAVHLARTAIAGGPDAWADDAAVAVAREFARSLLAPVVNATGVLLHTNLGRAPIAFDQPASAWNLEFDLTTGGRGSRHRAVGMLLAQLTGAGAAMVVNNNAAAVLLALAAVAAGRDVLVSRGESVEIGGSFRVPEVMEQSGARLVDVGTTNRTRLDDYRRAVDRHRADVAAILKVHPSNYRVEGFVEETTVAELATLGVPVIADIGSGLLDATTPWLRGTPAWLTGEPAAVQTVADGAALVTFSGDKLFGGPQAGIIIGRADLVARCARHPLARALRPGGHVLAALQQTVIAYLDRRATTDIVFWRQVAMPVAELRARATAVITAAGTGTVVDTVSLPGAGSAPGAGIASVGIELDGDHLAALRAHHPPVIARVRERVTTLDLRSVDPRHDDTLVAAIRSVA